MNIDIDDLIISDIRKININQIKELAENIDKNGLINPLTVRLINGKYEIIAGQRRYLALKELNKKEILCNIINIDDKLVNEISLIENIHRTNISNYDKIKSCIKIYENNDEDFTKIKSMIKISKAQMNKYLKIKDLPEEILEKLDAKDKSKITVDIAIELSLLPDNIDLLDVVEKITPLKLKNKKEAIIKFKEENSDDIDNLNDIIDDIISNEEKDNSYKKPYIFDSKKQKNLIIPENMYTEIIELINSKINEDELIYY